MADEYFDYDHEYNFRDRDVLLVGPAVEDMTDNFNEFWNSEFAVPVEDILADEVESITAEDVATRARELHAYADDPRNFAPQVRGAITSAPESFPYLLQAMSWEDVMFVSDIPGKNTGESGLGGGGETTTHLFNALSGAQESVLIQSPYLIMPEGGIELFAKLIDKGVRIRVSTNSLASTDNIQAFSGYHEQREDLLRAGVELYEFKPYPQIRDALIDRYPAIAESNPIFALHAKSMVVDGETVYIGTFNLDPRSANLNTEVGVLVDSKELADQLTRSIERDIRPENSWQTTEEFNPDSVVRRGKRFRVWLNEILPLEPVL
jgi:putative cardiolipin synthase